MMDPWWSFAVEAQAIDRVHRMGQTQKVEVVRFVTKESIEGRMLRVQERKMAVAGSLGVGQSGGGENEEERKKKRIEELRCCWARIESRLLRRKQTSYEYDGFVLHGWCLVIKPRARRCCTE